MDTLSYPNATLAGLTAFLAARFNRYSEGEIKRRVLMRGPTIKFAYKNYVVSVQQLASPY